jgi:hypothetical protein
MFCLQCGAEMAIRAQVCPVCGHVYGDRERALADSKPARAAKSAAVGGALNAPAAPRPAASVKYVGDLASPGLPRDLPGRFVLGVSLGMAADLLLPWVSVNGENITPASIGAPVVVVVALLAAATLPVYTASLRQHPVWSALPLMVAAFCAGIAGSVWLLLAPLSQIFASSFGSDPSNLILAPQGGLYLYLLGAAALLVIGQRMLAAMHAGQLADARRDAIRSAQAKLAAARPMTPISPMTPMTPATPPVSPATSAQPDSATRAASVWQPRPPTLPAAPAPTAPMAAPAPPTPQTPAAPVLPGSDAWNKPRASPTPVRPSRGGGWGKPRGPLRLR